MVEYREENGVRHSNTGRILGVVALVVLAVVAVLFATGFWTADVKEGALPDIDVSAKGGQLPGVDVDSKEVVVGTTSTNVEVPKVVTETKKIDVPVVGVKDD